MIEAAENLRAPVVALVSPSLLEGPKGERLLRAFRRMADEAGVEVLVQLERSVRWVEEPGSATSSRRSTRAGVRR